jgi:hypothetical protein
MSEVEGTDEGRFVTVASLARAAVMSASLYVAANDVPKPKVGSVNERPSTVAVPKTGFQKSIVFKEIGVVWGSGLHTTHPLPTAAKYAATQFARAVHFAPRPT